MAGQLSNQRGLRVQLQARRASLRQAVALAGCCLLAACAAAPGDAARLTPVRVELDAFSGRPNPSWSLTEKEVSDLWSRLLPGRAISGLPPSDALGYRGFSIHNPGVMRGVPERMYVSRGHVYVLSEQLAPQAQFEDRHGLEEWLQTLARERGFGSLLAR